MFKKICPVCGKEFEAENTRKVFCSKKCKGKHYREAHKEEILEYKRKNYYRYREQNAERMRKKKS